MKKILALIAIPLVFAACQDGKLCPYTQNIVDWSAVVASDGVKAAQLEQLTQAAVKNQQYDSVAIYTSQGVALAQKTIQDKDSLVFYVDACKDKGYTDTTKMDN